MLSFIFCLIGLVTFAQIDSNTGLRKPNPEPKPNTGLFGLGRRLAIDHLSPKPNPTGNEVIGKVGNTWGVLEFNDAAKILQGNVIDMTNATGLVVVDLELGTTDYQIFVTPITDSLYSTAISLKTDSAFTVKFWINDTVANINPVVFDYLIKKN